MFTTTVSPHPDTTLMVSLLDVVEDFNEVLNTAHVPDYSRAYNGLQVAAPNDHTIERLAVAVDASEHVIEQAVTRHADLLVVHHGLFWSTTAPVTGPLYRKLRLLIERPVALYASHLPLDGHRDYGNSALLIRALGLEPDRPFGAFEGFSIGWSAEVPSLDRDAVLARTRAAVEGPVHLIPGGPETITRIAVVTGAGGSFIRQAAAENIDLLVTGEGAHHTYAEAHEYGVNVAYAGHYATEVFGVRALAERARSLWGIEAFFIDAPSGL